MRMLTVLAAFVCAPMAALAANAGHGREVFQACAACHNNGPDALGPDLKGVVGRAAGVVDGYRYSAPLKRSGIGWTVENLRDFLRDPQAKVKGNRMPFSGLADPRDVEDVIAYLQTLK